jgi:gamma-glutamylputrescine oxidase
MTDARNFYYALTPQPAPHAALAGDHAFDVCVVGGGISGLSAALHLAERGQRVALLEAQHVGYGGSGRSGGQSIMGYACEQSTLEKAVGPADARRMWDVSIEGLQLQRDLIAKHAIDCDYVPGHMIVGMKPRHDDTLRAEVDTLRGKYDYHSIRLIGRDELRTLIASERYTSALIDSNGGHLHPYRYTLGLARAAAAAGVALFENSPVSRLEIAPNATTENRVHTAAGSIRARHVVIAGGALLGRLVPSLAAKLIDIGTYIAATQPLGEARARALITNNAAAADMNWILDYFRRSSDHRLLFGGRVSYSGLEGFDSAHVLRKRIAHVFPQLDDVRIEYSWGGYLDITMNRAPHFGRLGPSCYFLQGLSGHGMVISGMAGKLVSEVIGGTAERFDMYGRIPHADFPGGPLFRRPALVLAMLWFRILDLL